MINISNKKFDFAMEQNLSLSKLLKEKNTWLDLSRLQSECRKIDKGLARIVCGNLSQLTTYDMLMSVFFECAMNKSDVERKKFIAVLHAIDVLRVSYHLQQRFESKKGVKISDETIVNMCDLLNNKAKTDLLQLMPHDIVEEGISDIKKSRLKYNDFLNSLIQHPHEWTKKEWDYYISIYPDGVIIHFACICLCQIANMTQSEKSLVLEQLTTVANAQKELFLSTMEILKWKDNLLQKKPSAFTSLVNAKFAGNVQFEDIVRFVYECDFLIGLEDRIRNCSSVIEEVLVKKWGANSGVVNLILVPGQAALNNISGMRSALLEMDEVPLV